MLKDSCVYSRVPAEAVTIATLNYTSLHRLFNVMNTLPGVAYPGVRDNRSTINTKTGYDDDDDDKHKS